MAGRNAENKAGQGEVVVTDTRQLEKESKDNVLWK